MEFKDYYKIMGVPRTATQEEIKKAHRQLARKYHPDVSKEKDAEIRFKEIGEAYEVLKDAQKRAAYDQLDPHAQGPEFRPPPNWNSGFDFSGGGYTTAGTGDFSDFFESLFGAGPGHRSNRRTSYSLRGEDSHAKVLIDVMDAYQGSTQALTLQVSEIDPQGNVVLREQKLNVKIPVGIRPGQQIRLKGQGMPGIGQGQRGDLYLEVQFKSDKRYSVDGPNVLMSLRIAPWEAALGATVSTRTPGGPVEIRIPAGSATGNKLRMKGRGLPGDPPGDLFVVLQIVLPPATDEASEAFYASMAEKFKSFNPREEGV